MSLAISESSVNRVSRAWIECPSHLRQKILLLGAAGDSHALELAAELDVNVKVTGILVEMKERPRSAREITTIALPQLRKLTQLRQQRF